MLSPLKMLENEKAHHCCLKRSLRSFCGVGEADRTRAEKPQPLRTRPGGEGAPGVSPRSRGSWPAPGSSSKGSAPHGTRMGWGLMRGALELRDLCDP